MNHTVLIALLMKGRIRLKGYPHGIALDPNGPEQEDIGDRSKQLRHLCLVLSPPLGRPSKRRRVIREIGDASIFGLLLGSRERLAIFVDEPLHGSVGCFDDDLVPRVPVRADGLFRILVEETMAIRPGSAFCLQHLHDDLGWGELMTLLRVESCAHGKLAE